MSEIECPLFRVLYLLKDKREKKGKKDCIIKGSLGVCSLSFWPLTKHARG